MSIEATMREMGYEQATVEDIDRMIRRVDLQNEWLKLERRRVFYLCVPGYYNLGQMERLDREQMAIEILLYRDRPNPLEHAAMLNALSHKAYKEMGCVPDDDMMVHSIKDAMDRLAKAVENA